MAYNPQNINGQATSANSSPVVLASDQSSIPVTLATNTPDVTDRAGRQLGTITNTGFNVTGNGIVSTVNSSTTTLAANATFTGVGEDVSEYSTIMVTVFTNQASASDGLSIEQSSDGTNWDFSDKYAIPASTGKTFSVGVQAKFYRVVYTNGTTTNTVFRLQTLYSKTAKKFSSIRPQDSRTNDNDFEESLSYDMAFNGTGWDRVRSSIKGTQAANALATQDLKDSGRSRVSITFMAVAPATADTLLSLVKVTNGVAAAGATSIGVASGKILRINSITFSIKSGAAAAAFSTLTLRQNPTGATVITSVIEARVDVGNTAATIGASDKVELIFPDGMEFSGTQTLGISLAAQATTNIISISINGFEY